MDGSKIKINKKHGYYEVTPKPSEKELQEYYENKYYQEQKATYVKHYEDAELSYFYNKIDQKFHVINKLLSLGNNKSLLDIGCGEGFTLNYYKQKFWNVTGIDFSDFGLKTNNPDLLPNLKQGNIFKEITKLVNLKIKYDVVWLDNVLEHVIQPEDLIQQCYKITKNGGALVIEVPNDYSDFQKELLETKKIEKKYWEALPDHLTYFSSKSLQNICEYIGWKTVKIISDFPIEWFLSNKNSNYVNNNNTGKEAHNSRVFVENFIHNNQKNNMDNIINFYESMAKIGQGRQIIGFFIKNEI